MRDGKQAIRNLVAAWLDAVAAGDLPKLLGLRKISESGPFSPTIIADLMVGITFSTLTKNQMQAMQMTFFFFLPSLLLSGFMFPFRGMPEWAKYLGELFPLTHFLRIIRGILLKGNALPKILPEIWTLALFLAVAAPLP